MLNSEIVSQQRSQENIVRIMILLLKDAFEHFTHEELLFVEKSYPNAQEYSQIHAKLTGELEQALDSVQNSNHVRNWVENGLTVKNLLVDHKLNEDTKFINFLRAQ